MKTKSTEQKSEQKIIEDLTAENNLLKEEYSGLKKSFQMVKDNFEREKNRVDKLIQSLLNYSK